MYFGRQFIGLRGGQGGAVAEHFPYFIGHRALDDSSLHFVKLNVFQGLNAVVHARVTDIAVGAVELQFRIAGEIGPRSSYSGMNGWAAFIKRDDGIFGIRIVVVIFDFLNVRCGAARYEKYGDRYNRFHAFFHEIKLKLRGGVAK